VTVSECNRVVWTVFWLPSLTSGTRSRAGRRRGLRRVMGPRCSAHNGTMTERKPPGVSFESWVEKQIRQAQERGAFDDLPGAGKPLRGLDKPHDEMWWIKQKMDREGLSADALLPESLKLRKEIDRLPATVRALPSERLVHDAVGELNRRIAAWLRAPSGPQVHVAPVDAEEVVARWRESRRPAAPDATTAPLEQRRRRRWWQR
jgi:hypothetical protein